MFNVYKKSALISFSLLIGCSMFISGYVEAEVFKCVDEKGKVHFSDVACAHDAEVVDVDNDNAGISFKGGDIRKTQAANKRREEQRKNQQRNAELDSLNYQISRLEKEKAEKLADVDQKIEKNKTLTGNQRIEKLLRDERASIISDYNSRIKNASR